MKRSGVQRRSKSEIKRIKERRESHMQQVTHFLLIIACNQVVCVQFGAAAATRFVSKLQQQMLLSRKILDQICIENRGLARLFPVPFALKMHNKILNEKYYTFFFFLFGGTIVVYQSNMSINTQFVEFRSSKRSVCGIFFKIFLITFNS